MVGLDRHCQIVGASLSGERPVDERTHESIAVLSERLERLRPSSPLLAGVTFSPYVERLRRRAEAMAVG